MAPSVARSRNPAPDVSEATNEPAGVGAFDFFAPLVGLLLIGCLVVAALVGALVDAFVGALVDGFVGAFVAPLVGLLVTR